MKLIKLTQSGDTIIEVLIVLAVLGLSFGISSATASKSLTKSRNAEEHSRALGILGNQLEWLRTATAQETFTPPTEAFCMTNPTTYDSTFSSGFDPKDLEHYPTACVPTQNDSLYHLYIRYNSTPAPGYYDLMVRWDGAGGLPQQSEEMTYRVHVLTGTTDLGIPLNPAKSKVTIYASKIAKTADVNDLIPDCSTHSGASPAVGVSTTLTQSYPSKTISQPGDVTDSTGIKNYSDLTDQATYTASVGGLSNYQKCPDPDNKTFVAFGSTEVDFKYTPICRNSTIQNGPYYNTVTETRYNDYDTTVHHDATGHWESGWPHTGPDGRWGTWHGEVFDWTDGKQYRHDGSLDNDSGWWYNGFQYQTWWVEDTPAWDETVHHHDPYDYTYVDYDHPYYTYTTIKLCPGDSGY